MANQTITIKNGTLTLPKELWSDWQETSVIVKPQTKMKIILEKLPKKIQVNIKLWKKMAGILKNRELPDPLIWQNQIRKEWERQ